MSKGHMVRAADAQNRAARNIRNIHVMNGTTYWHSVLSDDAQAYGVGRQAMSSYYVTGGCDQDRMGMLSSMIAVHTALYPDVPVLALTDSKDHAKQIMSNLPKGVDIRLIADGSCANYDYGYGLNANEMVAILDKLTGTGSEQSRMHVYNNAFVSAVASQQPLCITSMRDLCRQVGQNPVCLANMPGIQPEIAQYLHDNTGCFYELSAKLDRLQLPATNDAYTNGENMLTTAASGLRGVMLMVMSRFSEACNALLAAELMRIREAGYNALLIVDGLTLAKDDPLRKAVEELVNKGGEHCMVCLSAANALVQCREQLIAGIQAWCILPKNLNAKELDTLLEIYGKYNRRDITTGGGGRLIRMPVLGENAHWGMVVNERQCVRREDLYDTQAVLTGKDAIYICRTLIA